MQTCIRLNRLWCIRLNRLWCGPHWYPVSPRSVPLLPWSRVSGWSLVSGVSGLGSRVGLGCLWSRVSGLGLVSGVSGLWCLGSWVSAISRGLAVRLGLRFSSGSSSPWASLSVPLSSSRTPLALHLLVPLCTPAIAPPLAYPRLGPQMGQRRVVSGSRLRHSSLRFWCLSAPPQSRRHSPIPD